MKRSTTTVAAETVAVTASFGTAGEISRPEPAAAAEQRAHRGLMVSTPSQSSTARRGGTMPRGLSTAVIAGAIAVAASGGCSSSDNTGTPPTVAGNAGPPPATVATPPATTVATPPATTVASTPATTGTSAADNGQLATAIQDIINASMAPGAINWNG